MVVEPTYGPAEHAARTDECWSRSLARMLDFILVFAILFLIVNGISGAIRLIFPESHFIPDTMLDSGLLRWLAHAAIITTVWALFDTVLLALWGTTPGKWFLGLKVSANTGSGLTLKTSFHRSVLVLVLGLGFCLPYVGFFATVVGYFRLERDAITYWDEKLKLAVEHQPVKVWRKVIAGLLWLPSNMLLVSVVVV